MTIENNYVKGAGGDAITLMYCDRPVIQYNVGDSVSKHMNDVDYPHDREHGGRYGGWVAAGIWPWRCKDPIFQYNEMYNNLNSEHATATARRGTPITATARCTSTTTRTATRSPR